MAERKIGEKEAEARRQREELAAQWERNAKAERAAKAQAAKTATPVDLEALRKAQETAQANASAKVLARKKQRTARATPQAEGGTNATGRAGPDSPADPAVPPANAGEGLGPSPLAVAPAASPSVKSPERASIGAKPEGA